MMSSRGMGDINPKKVKTIKKKDGNEPVSLYKKGGEVWDTPNPKKKPTKLSPTKKAAAMSRARSAGRPYPNLIDNMNAARKK
jgi:hypothetical protein